MPKELGDVAWPVPTARLTLRRATPDDADAVLSYRREPAVAQWIGAPPQDFHERFVAPERLDVLLLVERAGEVIGDLMVKVGNAWAPAGLQLQAQGVQAELGWSLRPAETGQGYATEAVEAVLRICFEDLRLRRVTASCFAANVPSHRLMERVGMRRGHASRGHHRRGLAPPVGSLDERIHLCPPRGGVAPPAPVRQMPGSARLLAQSG